jgi:hypothetical protein
VKAIVPIKEMEVNYYKDFADFLVKYEEVNEKQLSKGAAANGQQDMNTTTTLLYGSWGDELKQKLSKTVSSLFLIII